MEQTSQEIFQIEKQTFSKCSEESKFSRENIYRDSCPFPMSTKPVPLLERFQKKFKTLPILDKFNKEYLFFNKKQNIHSPMNDEYSIYIENEIIGEGSQGLVKKVTNKRTNEEFAAKIIRKSDSEGINYYRKEFEMLKSMSHPNILKVNAFIVREYHQSIVILMELLTTPTLKDLIHLEITLKNEILCAKIIKALLDGVEYLHELGVCHRDLKPSNIFVNKDGSDLKIIDFGTAQYYQKTSKAKVLEKKELWSPTGTENYKSPEQIVGKTNEKSDIYSIGLILYEMITKKKPFGKKKGEKLLYIMEHEIYDLDTEIWSKFDINLKILIKKLLCSNENERISAKEAKNSDWLKKILQ